MNGTPTYVYDLHASARRETLLAEARHARDLRQIPVVHGTGTIRRQLGLALVWIGERVSGPRTATVGQPAY